MRRSSVAVGVLAVLFLAVAAWALDGWHTVAARVYFSPRGGAQAAIIEEINAAQQPFTARPIAEALILAQ